MTLSCATFKTIDEMSKNTDFQDILLKDQNAKSIYEKKLSIIRDRFIHNVIATATYPFCSLIGHFAAQDVNRKRAIKLVNDTDCLIASKKYNDVDKLLSNC